MTDASDDRMTILNAIITNTRVKICFGGLAPDDAEFMSRVLFSGFLDLEAWKEQSARPTAIGNKKEIVRSASRAQQQAEHETYAKTTSHSRGEAVGTMTSTSVGAGDFSSAGDSAGLVMQAPAQLLGPSAPGAQSLPVPLTQSEGQSTSAGSSEMSSSSTGASHVAVDMYGEAETRGYGKSRGTSVTEGASETYVTDWARLPTQMFSLPEQQFKAVGDLINLGLRECYLKIGNAKPMRTRTLDVKPGFRSHFARRVMLPIFRANSMKRSPYLLPAAEVDAQIAARLPTLKPPLAPDPDFTRPEPMPVLDAPVKFAADFWSKRRPPGPDDEPPKPKPRKPRGRKPVGYLPPGADRFRVIDGDGDKRK